MLIQLSLLIGLPWRKMGIIVENSVCNIDTGVNGMGDRAGAGEEREKEEREKEERDCRSAWARR